MGNAWCDVHRVAETKTFVHAAAQDEVFNCIGDVHEAAAALNFEPKVLGQRFHCSMNSKLDAVAF